ncbi:claudin-10-like isoform X2 [Phycodurus eques]|uniref:claudin-10-like isoform X2 n=1 Tax=Phycodurus eques TaxID=693459 RepID=UPI002ACE8D7F|nr:claudin-10-like isoform X2 [Phycodurus eques]
MGYRTVVMYMEIGCFVVCVSGWILVCSTMPTEIWTWSEVGSLVLTTSNYFSNLWKDCISDSTGVSDCKGIPSLLALNWDIHMCRALIITAIILAFFGSVLVMVGMKCTKIGGSQLAKARVTFAGGMNYLFAGLCSMTAFSYYGNKIRAEFQDPNYREQNYEGDPGYVFPDPYLAVPTKKKVALTDGTESRKAPSSRTSNGNRSSANRGSSGASSSSSSSVSAVTISTRTSDAYV